MRPFHRNYESRDGIPFDSPVSHECVLHIVALTSAQSFHASNNVSEKGAIRFDCGIVYEVVLHKVARCGYFSCFANTSILRRANLKFLLQNFCVWLHSFLLNSNESASSIRLSIYIYLRTKAKTTKITYFTTSGAPRWARPRGLTMAM